MARVQFNSESEEIVGKLAGSVFQDSYMGMQVRGLPKPRNPQTQLQQLRRGRFGYLSESWRSLSSAEKETWIDVAGTNPAALRYFIGNNINLTLIEVPAVTSYTEADKPNPFPLFIYSATTTSLLITAADEGSVVPAGFKLLVFATTDKQEPKEFTNPSEYSPVAYFDEGQSFYLPVDIIAQWRALYGQLRNARRICIKTALISKTNGNRADSEPSCALTSNMKLYLFTLTQSGTDNPAVTDISNTTTMTVATGRIGAGYYYIYLQGTIPALDKIAGGISFPVGNINYIVQPDTSIPAYYLQTINTSTGNHEDNLLTETLFSIVDNN